MLQNKMEFWFVVGSQFLYGPEVLETVVARAAEMVDKLNASGNLPCKLVYQVTAKTNQEITEVVRKANYDPTAPASSPGATPFLPAKCGSTAWSISRSPGAISPPSITGRSPTKRSTWTL